MTSDYFILSICNSKATNWPKTLLLAAWNSNTALNHLVLLPAQRASPC